MPCPTHPTFNTGSRLAMHQLLRFFVAELPEARSIASKPIADLRAASVVQNTLRMSFSDGSRLSLGAMPLRDLALLERTLRSRRSDLRLF